MTTAQEKLWRGRFGDDYTERQDISLLDTQAFFTTALNTVPFPHLGSVIEFGANEGANLVALRGHAVMKPKALLVGVEINANAFERLRKVADQAWLDSVATFSVPAKWDLTLAKGLLIHLHPSDLPAAYDTLYRHSVRYILIAEYFNATPVSIPYRGETDALWKRDFGGDMLDRFSDLECLDYGFVWKRDEHPQDNLTWWLFEK